MENILAISEQGSYLLVSLKEKMEEKGFNMKIVKADINAISKVGLNLSAILIYSDEEMANEAHLFNYLKDKVIDENIPVFIVGSSEEIEAVEKTLPKSVVQREFIRPVNVKDLSDSLADYITNHGKMTKKKVLVVDDSGAMLRNVKGWLEDKYQVILANSGTMAIKYLAINSPDLILLDYEMPVCDGKQVLEMIRSESEYASVPVIFLTSKSDKESVMSVTALKPAGYLLKTMEPKQIVKAIDDFFEKQRLAKLSSK